MRRMIEADLLKLRRRRGLWLTSLILPSALVVLVFVLTATNVADLEGGSAFVQDLGGALAVVGPVLAVLIGARQGSDERAAGTLRYQLLTGVPRERLLASKLAVLAISCVVIATLGTFTAVICGSLLGGDEAVSVTDVADVWWESLLPALCYGAISFGVGLLMGSTGPAITISLVLNFVGANILAALTLISDVFANIVLPIGIDRLTSNTLDGEEAISLGAAIALVLAYPAIFVGAAYAKLRTLEA